MSQDKLLVAGQYDKISHDYEAWYTLDWPEPVYKHGEAIDKIIKSHGFHTPANILDLTCGIGTQSLGLAVRGHRLTSIDLSKGQLNRAKEEEKNFSIPNPVHWIEGDSTHPSNYTAGSFDAAISFGTSLPLLGSEAAIYQSMKETFSLLKSGGLLLISMIDHTELRKNKPYLLETGPLNHNGKKGIYLETANWLEDGKRYQSNIIFVWTSPQHQHVHYPFPPLAALTKQEFMNMLNQIGYENIQFHETDTMGFNYPLYIANKA